MIISKTTYETSDGKSLDTELKALEYEKSLEDGTYNFCINKKNYRSHHMSIIFASDSYSKILNKKQELENDNLTGNY